MPTPAYSSNDTTSVSRGAHYGIVIAALVTGIILGAVITASLLSRQATRVRFAKDTEIIAIAGGTLDLVDKGQRDRLRVTHEKILAQAAREAAARAPSVDKLPRGLAPVARDVALTEKLAQRKKMTNVAKDLAIVRQQMEAALR